ncbi:MAG: aminoacetone oxidase family FAD-binding enzyme, partial [Clostridia bacterium]|nr:aminoacetone oxidase family FAD-binding enzyme [Clostridia bacterium]
MGKIAIIGGGAAGLLAAGTAGEKGADVTLFEKNPMTGKKILITGKGRCNVTCDAEVREMEKHLPRGGKFLRSALYAFPPSEVFRFFEEEGVPLKIERGGRVFPVSDRARDIRDALERYALREKNVTLKKEKVLSVKKDGEAFLIETPKGTERFQRVLIATGGLSYPGTGSDGDGYRFAKAFGHHITPCRPALIPLTVKESLPADAMGLSLKNIAARFETLSGKRVYEDFGEMLFCHFGVSGPVILSASSYLDFEKEKEYRLFLDLKPALTTEELDKRVLSDFKDNQNRDFINALSRL